MHIPNGASEWSVIDCLNFCIRQIIEHDLVLRENVKGASKHYAIQAQDNHEPNDVVEDLYDRVNDWRHFFMQTKELYRFHDNENLPEHLYLPDPWGSFFKFCNRVWKYQFLRSIIIEHFDDIEFKVSQDAVDIKNDR